VSKPWIFMGVDRSHFSAKLRPALRYKQLHVLEYPPDMAEIVRRTGVGFVPVVVTPEGDMIQDTTDIIDLIEQRVPDPPLLPASGSDLIVCRLFELYADEFFPMVSMRTRWAYPDNEVELRRAFAAFSGSLDQGNAVADRMSGFLPSLGVTDQTIPAIDAHTDDMLDALNRHLAIHPFLLGNRMSLADCALMGPLYAHLYLDRVTRRKLYEEAIEVCMWIERCNRPVPEAMGAGFDGEYPETLKDILSLIGSDAMPMLTAMDAAFQAWAAGNAEPGMEVPRSVAEYQTVLRGTEVTAAVRSYVSWKIQRLVDAVSPDAADSVKGVLTETGCGELFTGDHDDCHLEKRDFKLVVS